MEVTYVVFQDKASRFENGAYLYRWDGCRLQHVPLNNLEEKLRFIAARRANGQLYGRVLTCSIKCGPVPPSYYNPIIRGQAVAGWRGGSTYDDARTW
jgi:hypothetical protein